MNCLEAQSKIVAFIEDKLDDGEVLGFVRHIRSCENCAEELEIYYTLLVGMKQLDEDKILSMNFKDQMEEKLNVEYKHIQNRRKLTGSSVGLFLILACVLGFFGYRSYQQTLYLQQQANIKAQQSPSYYYDYFGTAIFHPEDYVPFDLTEHMVTTNNEEQSSYYEKLHQYIMKHGGNREIE